MAEQQQTRVLILGLTYPSYSLKYHENVCTGALVDGSFEMIRIHPVPLRYMDGEQRFSSWRWVRVDMERNTADPRPESFRINPSTVVVEDPIPSSKPEVRRGMLLRSPHVVRSVEELIKKQERDRTSLGIVKPAEITGFRLQRRPDQERQDWLEKEQALLRQVPLFDKPSKPLDFPEVEFLVAWRCDDPECTGHEMGLKQWGLHELYRSLAGDGERDQKVLARMRERLDTKTRDVYFFMGNFRERMYQFGLMDSYSIRKSPQLGLFGAGS